MAHYTTIDDIKRILRSNGTERIRFSDCITSVLVEHPRHNTKVMETNLDMIFNYRLVEIAPEYSGEYLLKLVLVDSGTFRGIEIDPVSNRELTLGLGSVQTDWESPDGTFTIPSECWGGIVKEHDQVQIRFSSHLSDNDVVSYIEEAETRIDAMLEEHQILFIDELAPAPRRIFKPGEVPDRIKVAATYLASYYIFTNTFADLFKDKDSLKFSYVRKWLERAESGIMEYIIGTGRRAPLVLGFPRFIDKIGSPDAGPGLSGISSDFRTLTRDAGVDGIFR